MKIRAMGLRRAGLIKKPEKAKPEGRGRPENPFAHRSNKEVFGDDEGLRLFDVDKRARGVGDSTGSLFGI